MHEASKQCMHLQPQAYIVARQALSYLQIMILGTDVIAGSVRSDLIVAEELLFRLKLLL